MFIINSAQFYRKSLVKTRKMMIFHWKKELEIQVFNLEKNETQNNELSG
jgi:hypothetical protein